MLNRHIIGLLLHDLPPDYKVWSCLQQTPLPTSLLSNQQLRLRPPKPFASLCLVCNQIFHHRCSVFTFWQTNKWTVLGALHTVLLPTSSGFLAVAIHLLCWRRCRRIRIFPFQGVHHQRTLKCVKMSSIPPFVPVSDRFML